MADKLQSPLQDPVKRPHKAMEFDIQDVQEDLLPAIDREDDFDIPISDDDDFDIE